MTIEITLDSGTKIKLTESEFGELRKWLSKEQMDRVREPFSYIPYPTYPSYPSYPYCHPWKPMEITYTPTTGVGVGGMYSGTTGMKS